MPWLPCLQWRPCSYCQARPFRPLLNLQCHITVVITGQFLNSQELLSKQKLLSGCIVNNVVESLKTFFFSDPLAMARFKPLSISESDLKPYPISKLFLYRSFIITYFFSFILLKKTFLENLFICVKIGMLLQIRFHSII